MKRYQNLLLIIAIVALIALPLYIVKRPVAGSDGKQAEIFMGADDKAKILVNTISPDYKPWFKPIIEPPSSEISTLLFTLQAAFGAGFIGYWYACSKTRAKSDPTFKTAPKC